MLRRLVTSGSPDAIPELALIDRRGASDIMSVAVAVFGNAITSRIELSFARIATMRSRPRQFRRGWRPVLERFDEEPEPQLGVLGADVEQAEDPALHRRIMNPDAAAAISLPLSTRS
jgi:hypothetical protein